jgi:hypothetical protein
VAADALVTSDSELSDAIFIWKISHGVEHRMLASLGLPGSGKQRGYTAN